LYKNYAIKLVPISAKPSPVAVAYAPQVGKGGLEKSQPVEKKRGNIAAAPHL
jgi:hypothetical protein